MTAAREGVAHKIHSPHSIELREDSEQLAQTDRQSLLRPARQIRSQLTIHAPKPLMVPGMPIEPQPIATFPKAPTTLGGHERRERRNHRRIAPAPVHERPIVCLPAEAHRGTGPLNRKAALTAQVSNDLPPFSKP